MKTIANTIGLSVPIIVIIFFYFWMSNSWNMALYFLFLGSGLVLFFSLIINLFFKFFLSYIKKSSFWTEFTFVTFVSLMVITTYYFIHVNGVINWLQYVLLVIPSSILCASILVPFNRWTDERI